MRPVGADEQYGRGTGHFDRDAVSGHSALKRCGSSVHGACQNLGPGPQAGLRRSLLRDGSDHVDRLADRREQLCRYAVGLQQLAAPAAVQDVIALRNTRVRGVEREASGEPEVQIAVCLQDPSCFFIKRGLVLLEPEKLTVDVERIGLVAGDPVDCPVADPAPHVDALRVRAAVHPDQRVSERPASCVHRQHGRCL